MKILVANIPLPQNRFLVDLNAAIAHDADVTHNENMFWNQQGNFDVVHLHFPEYLTLAHQDAYRQGLQDDLINATAQRLAWWGQRSKLVITRHVLLPHDALHDPQWEKMYEAVYRHVHAVVHFASASVDEFRERYRRTDFLHGQPNHFVVPHHNYTSLPNTVSRAEARRQLEIPEHRQVMLVFGTIRNLEECQLILKTFQGLRVPGKLLLVSRWKEQLAKVRWIRLKYWLRDLNRLYYRLHPQYHFNYGFVEEADTQLWLNAADVLFIPRLKVLNSGNITLGMTFGKVVVGPDSWDVGQLLRETGNPVFDPDRPETAIEAVEQGFRLAAEGHRGPENQRLALNEWSAEQCARQYLQVFRDVRRSHG
jgi:glycosyltransferase involved in cell wall biosynthesis